MLAGTCAQTGTVAKPTSRLAENRILDSIEQERRGQVP
jgi:hypothetical protein